VPPRVLVNISRSVQNLLKNRTIECDFSQFLDFPCFHVCFDTFRKLSRFTNFLPALSIFNGKIRFFHLKGEGRLISIAQRLTGWILSYALALLLFQGCGGAPASVNVQSNLSEESAFFTGLQGVERQSDGSWLLTWSALSNGLAIYGIFKASTEAELDYSQPFKTTKESLFRYKSDNVISEEKRCFAVRVLGGSDSNKKVICNNASPAKFSGITELTHQYNGSLLIRWSKLPVDDSIYWIFERDSSGSYNFSTPSFQQNSDFYTTRVIPRGESKCYVVRAVHAGYGVDSNQTELCSKLEPAFEFSGKPIVGDKQLDGSRNVTWNASSTIGVVGYRVYMDNACSVLANCSTGLSTVTTTSCLLSNLTIGNTSVCVVAIDAAGRESDPIISDPFTQ